MNDDLGGNRVGEAEVIGRRQAIYQHSRLIAPGERVDGPARIGICRLPGQLIGSGQIVEAARNPSDVTCRSHAGERLVNGMTRAEVQEIHRCPRGY